MYSARNRGSLDDRYNDVSSVRVYFYHFFKWTFKSRQAGAMTSYSMSMDKIDFKSISQ